MNLLFSIGFFIMGIMSAIAGRDVLVTCALFIVYGILQGVNELSLMRQEMEDWEDDDNQ